MIVIVILAARSLDENSCMNLEISFAMCGFSTVDDGWMDDDAGLVVLSRLGNTGTGTDDDAGGEGLIPRIHEFRSIFWMGLFAGARARFIVCLFPLLVLFCLSGRVTDVYFTLLSL